jgi:type II secretory pathway pseudopilin PulG
MRRRASARGVLLAELLVVVTIIGVAALTASVHLTASARAADRARRDTMAAGLASALMEEVVCLRWDEDTTTGSTVLGTDPSEVSRNLWDDIDDFDSHLQSPPTDPLGVAIPGFGGYGRRVSVAYVSEDLSDTTTRTPRKRVTVTVSRNGEDVYTLKTLAAAGRTIAP